MAADQRKEIINIKIIELEHSILQEAMFCKIVLPSNEIFKLAKVPMTFIELKEVCSKKLADKQPKFPSFKYKDSDEELILLTNDEDLETAILTAEEDKVKTLRIFIQPSEHPPESQPGSNPNQKPNIIQEQKESILEQIPLSNSNVIQSNKIVSEPMAKNSEEDDEISRLANSIPLIGLRKSISHPPKHLREPEDEKLPTPTQRKISFDFNNAVFTEQQLKVLAEIIDKKIKERIENKINSMATDIILRATEEFKRKGPFPGSGGMPGFKKIVPIIKREENFKCDQCKNRILGIRYSCTQCNDFDFCEKCEATVPHPHPFIKHKERSNESEDNMKSSLISMMNSNKIINSSSMQNSIVSQNNSIISNSSQNLIPAKIETPGNFTPGGPVKEKKYSAKIENKSQYDVLNVEPDKIYNVAAQIKNSGTETWPDIVLLTCIAGIHQGKEIKVPSLEPGKDQIINLALTAPVEVGKYVSHWRLQYFEGDSKNGRYFGTNFFVDINVIEDKTKNMDKAALAKLSTTEREIVMSKNYHDILTFIDTGCDLNVLEKAKMLNDLFENDGLKEKIDFVASCPSNMSINEVVQQYLDWNSLKSKKSLKNSKRDL